LPEMAVHWLQSGRIAQALLWQAEHAQEQGRHRQAVRYLNRYLEFVPADLEKRAELGWPARQGRHGGLGKRGGPGELGAQSGAHRGSRPARHPTHAGQAANDGPAPRRGQGATRRPPESAAGQRRPAGRTGGRTGFEAAGKHSDAVTAWRAALKGRPDDAALMIRLGQHANRNSRRGGHRCRCREINRPGE